MKATDSKPTVAAVVKYAARLRQRASRIQAGDMWARPYCPSDQAARKLASRVGAQQAINQLARKAVEADQRHREYDQLAKTARQNHERYLQHAIRHEQKRRHKLSYGKRIDDALAKLSVVSGIPAAGLEADKISGGETTGLGALCDDLPAKVSTTARLAAESIERELDDARRRVLTGMEPDRDARLKKFARGSLTAVQISITDPSQGSPSRIRDRLSELGLR